MISVCTLDASALAAQPAATLPTLLHALRQQEHDFLCCQNLLPHSAGNHDLKPLLAKAVGLTCSCFAPAGLAIFTGPGVWVLNSGSLTLDTPARPTTVLFALTRKQGASVLVLNLHLAATGAARDRQVRELAVHPLLRDNYGAVLLCADRPAELPGRDWVDLSPRMTVQSEGPGLLRLLAAGPSPWKVLPLQQAAAAHGQSMVFELQRSSANRYSRPSFPLSFREQWLGYREHRVFA